VSCERNGRQKDGKGDTGRNPEGQSVRQTDSQKVSKKDGKINRKEMESHGQLAADVDYDWKITKFFL